MAVFLCSPILFQDSEVLCLNGNFAESMTMRNLLPSSGIQRGIGYFMQVLGGFLLPCYLNYNSQLRARRQFRKQILTQRLRSASGMGEGSLSSTLRLRDRGLDIRPIWKLHLPEGIAFVVLSYAAGQNTQLLQYML